MTKKKAAHDSPSGASTTFADPLESVFASISTEYLIALSEDLSANKEKAGALVELLAKTLGASGLSVTVDTQPGVEIPEGTKRFVTVSAPRHLIDLEGEHLEYLKTTTDGKKMEFAVHDGARFAGIADAGFWLPCEEAQLLWSLIEHVELSSPEKALEPFLGELKEKRRHVIEEQARTSIIAALQIADLLEVTTPLHRPAALRKIWKASLRTVGAPVQELHDYFGSHVAFYFAWMNHFTLWLTAPGAVGVGVWWHKVTYGYTVDDSPLIPFFSLFVVLWAVAFVAFWRRGEAEWACRWGTIGEEEKEEVRPEFHGELVTSPITGRPVRRHPYYKRLVAFALSAGVTTFMLSVALVLMACMLNLEGYIQDTSLWTEKMFFVPPLAALAAPGGVFDPNQTRCFGLIALVPTLLHVVTIQRLNAIYRGVAGWLTENENHRTKQAHEDSLILKRLFFEAFDTYIALFYLAFIQVGRSVRWCECEEVCLCVRLRRRGRRVPFGSRFRSALFRPRSGFGSVLFFPEWSICLAVMQVCEV